MASSYRAAEIALAVALAVGLPEHASAQRSSRAPKWFAEAAAAISRPLVEDGNGTTLTPGVAPVIGIIAGWPTGSRTMVMVGFQGSTFSVQLEDGGVSWSGGQAWQVDIMGSVEHEIAGCTAGSSRGAWCTSGRGALGGTWLRGPDDILPFRFGGPGPHPAGELGVTVRLLERRPLSASLLARAFRLGAGRANDPISASGTALQFRFGARYGL